MNEPLPLAVVQEAVLEFLRHRDDAVLFGAQAVNAYVDEPRMTQDVDILSTRASEFAEELRSHLASRFHMAVRIPTVAQQQGFRIYQLRQPKNRQLVDVRQVSGFPPTQLFADVRVPMPEDLIAQKVISLDARFGQPKGDTDRRDLKVLLLAFPGLKSETGIVVDRLHAMKASDRALQEWRNLVTTEIERGEDQW